MSTALALIKYQLRNAYDLCWRMRRASTAGGPGLGEASSAMNAKHDATWDKLAKLFLEQGYHPQLSMQAILSGSVRIISPRDLLRDRFFNIYASASQEALRWVRDSLHFDRAQARLSASNASIEHPDDLVAARVKAVTDPMFSITPLYRYLMAADVGHFAACDYYLDAAAAQYLMSKREYDTLLSGQLTSRLRKRAEELLDDTMADADEPKEEHEVIEFVEDR